MPVFFIRTCFGTFLEGTVPVPLFTLEDDETTCTIIQHEREVQQEKTSLGNGRSRKDIKQSTNLPDYVYQPLVSYTRHCAVSAIIYYHIGQRATASTQIFVIIPKLRSTLSVVDTVKEP